MANDEHEGASIQEQLIEACRRNNTELLEELIDSVKNEDELSRLLNETKSILGNHLYHEAAAQGHYDVIDMLLDQPNFECDPINRTEGNTPLHTAINWINSEPLAQRPFGNELVQMMLEAGSNTRTKNKAGLTPLQLVDPSNKELRELILEHEYAEMNAGDFIDADDVAPSKAPPKLPAGGPPPLPGSAAPSVPQVGMRDDDEFSGSDEEERVEWERRRA